MNDLEEAWDIIDRLLAQLARATGTTLAYQYNAQGVTKPD